MPKTVEVSRGVRRVVSPTTMSPSLPPTSPLPQLSTPQFRSASPRHFVTLTGRGGRKRVEEEAHCRHLKESLAALQDVQGPAAENILLKAFLPYTVIRSAQILRTDRADELWSAHTARFPITHLGRTVGVLQLQAMAHATLPATRCDFLLELADAVQTVAGPMLASMRMPPSLLASRPAVAALKEVWASGGAPPALLALLDAVFPRSAVRAVGIASSSGAALYSPGRLQHVPATEVDAALRALASTHVSISVAVVDGGPPQVTLYVGDGNQPGDELECLAEVIGEVTHKQQPAVPASVKDTIRSSSFNVLAYENELDMLVEAVVWYFDTEGYLREFGTPGPVMRNFVRTCKQRYNAVPYHSFLHAVDVFQTAVTFIHRGVLSEWLKRIDLYALLLACLVHDVEHDGNNNAFQSQVGTPRGLLAEVAHYDAVHEMHHSFVCMSLLTNPATNVLCGMSEDDRKHATTMILHCVLATDMGRHREFCALRGEDFRDASEATARRVRLQVLIKAADISNVTKPFAVASNWAVRVREEFFEQGDRQRSLGFQVAAVFDRYAGPTLAQGQLGFIDVIARPYFAFLIKWFPTLRWLVADLDAVRQSWASAKD